MSPSIRQCAAALVLMSGAVAPAPLLAQAALDPGSRIRITTPQGRIEGLLVSGDSERLTVAGSDGTPRSIPRASIRDIRVASGRRSNTLLGLSIGAAIGAAGGLALVTTTDPCRPPPGFTRCELDPRAYAGAGAVILVIGGAALGAGIGALTHRTRWDRVEITGAGVTVHF